MTEPPPPTNEPTPPAVSLRSITRTFGPVQANVGVDFTVARGEIHALVGENGAGKSTLMKVLFGLVAPDEGTVAVEGRVLRRASPRDAMEHGLGMVHQHFMLVETATVAENVFLGREPIRAGVFLDRDEARRRVREVSDAYGLSVDPGATVEDLPVGVKQRVEILKALARGARILILDEPTAVLTPGEVDALFATLSRLKEEGKTIILITHKLDEVMAVADRVTVMRAGRVVGVLPVEETDAAALARLMVGREVSLDGEPGRGSAGEVVLELRDLRLGGRGERPALDDVSLSVRAGEILGIAGVDGNGQAELEDVVVGVVRPDRGAVLLDGRDVTRLGTRQRLSLGLGHIPQDRLVQGLVEEMSLTENLLLGRHFEPDFTRWGLLRRGEIRAMARASLQAFDVRPPLPAAAGGSLSGGNQQKLVAARELSRSLTLLLAAHPTRGVDIAATEFMHGRIRQARDRGAAVLLISAELSEVLSLSNRVAVMHRGRVVKVFDAPPTREEVGRHMLGAD